MKNQFQIYFLDFRQNLEFQKNNDNNIIETINNDKHLLLLNFFQ